MKLNLKENIKSIHFWLFLSIAISVVLGIIFALTYSNVIYVATLISCIPWLLMIAISVVFAWIINPIRALIKRRKEK